MQDPRGTSQNEKVVLTTKAAAGRVLPGCWGGFTQEAGDTGPVLRCASCDSPEGRSPTTAHQLLQGEAARGHQPGCHSSPDHPQPNPRAGARPALQTPEPHSPQQGSPRVLSRPCTATPIFPSPPAHLGTREACGSLPIPSPPRPGAPLGMPVPHPDFAQAPGLGCLGARHRERPGEPQPLDMTTARRGP